MSAGIDWNEGLPYTDPKNTGSQMEASSDWVEYTINRPMAAEPGKTFAYNSGATQIVAHVFRVATGTDIEKYAVRHLFTPLGINQFYWKRSPSGLVDAQGGIYLRPGDLAKLWYLFLNGGKWGGKQIVSREWVKDSITPHMDLGPNAKYGLKWWLYPYGKDNKMLAWSGSGPSYCPNTTSSPSTLPGISSLSQPYQPVTRSVGSYRITRNGHKKMNTHPLCLPQFEEPHS
jgi:CubicO group peptidase (beta-lactamase class C family)